MLYSGSNEQFCSIYLLSEDLCGDLKGTTSCSILSLETYGTILKQYYLPQYQVDIEFL